MKMKLKVLHVMAELKFSGAEFLLHSGAKQLQSVGKNDVLSTGKNLGEFSESLVEKGYSVFHLPFSKHPGFFLRLFNLIYRGKYDIVHVHTERSAIWIELIALASGAQCVRTVHNEFLFTTFLKERRSLERRVAVKLGVKHVACSFRVQQNERDRFGIDVILIDNWIDLSRLPEISLASRASSRIALGLPADAFVITSVGNASPAKNYTAIVDVVNDWDRRPKLIYQQCGAGSLELTQRREVTDLAETRLLGPVRDIADYLVASDVFVNTSFFEGQPISLLEAGATGLICITAWPGSIQTFENSPGIEMIEPTALSLRAALDRVVEETIEQRIARGGMNIEVIRRRFVPQVGAVAYVSLYRSLF